MDKLQSELLKKDTFEVSHSEKEIIVDNGNYYFMLVCSLASLAIPLLLLLCVPFMTTIEAFFSTVIGLVSFVFMFYANLPLFGQLLRGKCIIKIENDQLKNHKIAVPIDHIKTVKIGMNPNPFLWIYEYLIVTDINNKKHHFNLYNMTNKKTLFLMLDVYVFNKK